MKYIEIDYEFVHETEDAVLIHDGDLAEHWIPKSLILDSEHLEHNNEMEIQEWFAIKEGLV